MSRTLLFVSALVLAASSLVAGPKCDNAKEVLAEKKSVLEDAAKSAQAKMAKKIAIPAKIKLLQLAIKMDRETACEKLLESLHADLEALKK